jgi:tRNA dimethylallyltransferase
MPMGPPPILIAGPTASGKSNIALHLAARHGGEIISVDSMQVYRGLDIGTAKPAPDQRRRVPHHLLDLVDPDESFDVARFAILARGAIAGIQARGATPILCGGTGLYFKALLAGLGKAPAADAKLRRELEQTPLPRLLEELRARDPETWKRLDRNNPRRVLRAVEVLRLTGKPFTAQRSNWKNASGLAVGRFVAVERDPADLRRRVDDRVEEMFRRGLVGETRRLLTLGLAESPTARLALGYRQVIEHLEGVRSLPETIQLIKTRTWQYARRQRTWFRHQLNPVWIHVPPDEPAEVTASRILGESGLGPPVHPAGIPVG